MRPAASRGSAAVRRSRLRWRYSCKGLVVPGPTFWHATSNFEHNNNRTRPVEFGYLLVAAEKQERLQGNEVWSKAVVRMTKG